MGAGGVGGFFGGLLAARGGRVTFVARGAHGEAIRRDGLTVRAPDGSVEARSSPDVVLPGEAPPRADAVVLAVKHRDLAGALAAAAPAVGEGAPVLSLLNGIGHEADLRRALPRARPLVGTAFVGAQIESPGVVLHTSEGRIAFGEAPGPGGEAVALSPAARALADALAAGGFPVKAVDDVRPIIWRKLLWNAAFNTANALTGTTCAALLAEPSMYAHLRAVMEEIRAVARAEKIDIPDAWIEKSLSADVNHSEYKTSMFVDREAGRSMEIDTILDRPIRIAARRGVAVPRLEALSALLRGVEAHRA